MNGTAPERGAGSDDPTGQLFGRQDRPAGHLEGGEVRTGSSDADDIQLCATTTSGANPQSERGLDSAEWSPYGEPEARASGKSAAKRSEASETTGGSGAEAVPSAGWRAVAEALDASGGMRP
jgi:hypothetical protein